METGNSLVDEILDTAGQKGTGKWTSQAAMDFGVPVPTIDSAVSMRQISASKAVRQKVAELYDDDLTQHHTAVGEEDLHNALSCAFIITYAQGMSLLQAASKDKGFGLDLAQTAKIWRGGCIIRSALLEEMRAAYSKDPDLATLLLDKKFAEVLTGHSMSLRGSCRRSTATASRRSVSRRR